MQHITQTCPQSPTNV